jgi:hypothetical protein
VRASGFFHSDLCTARINAGPFAGVLWAHLAKEHTQAAACTAACCAGGSSAVLKLGLTSMVYAACCQLWSGSFLRAAYALPAAGRQHRRQFLGHTCSSEVNALVSRPSLKSMLAHCHAGGTWCKPLESPERDQHHPYAQLCMCAGSCAAVLQPQLRMCWNSSGATRTHLSC